MPRQGKDKRWVSGSRSSRYMSYGKGLKSKRRSVTAAARKAALQVLNTRTGGFMGIENKFLDTELTATALGTAWVPLNPTGTGCTDSLSVPAEGNGESQRIGRMYTIDSIFVHGVVRSSAIEAFAAPVSDFRARVILYWDTQTNSAEAAATDIMDAGGTEDLLAFRNLQNSKRFIVFFDKTILFRVGDTSTNEGAVNSFAAAPMERPFSFYKKFSKGIEVRCDATTANVTSVTDNNFGIACITSSTTTAPTIAYQARLRFRG